jgi:HK97 family phage portal protein
MGIMGALSRIVAPRQKMNPAGEGNWHAGPYRVRGGVLPWSSVPWNFWQADMDPLPYPACSTVEACVWAYIRAIAQLPGYHKRETGDGGAETITSSALSRLLRAPNGYETPSDFLVHLIRSLLLNGNSYWIAQRNDRQEVTALHWTDPAQCQVREVGVTGEAFNEVFYEISGNPLLEPNVFGTRNLVIPARDVFHVKLATPRHPLIGETWLQALAYELATRGAMNTASVAFAKNMSRPSGVLSTDLVLTAAQIDDLRKAWEAQASGLNAGGVPILSAGFKFQPISMSNVDAQIVEQLRLSDRTIAAVFGVPAILLGFTDTGTAKSAEAVMGEWLASGLGWLINHIEVAFDAFIGLNTIPAGREWTEFDTRMLLRSLFAERITGLVKGVQGGIFSPNEARALEGYPAVTDGEEPRVQQQVVPLSAWSQPPPKTPAPQAPEAPPPAAPAAGEEEGEGEEGKAAPTLTLLRQGYGGLTPADFVAIHRSRIKRAMEAKLAERQAA